MEKGEKVSGEIGTDRSVGVPRRRQGYDRHDDDNDTAPTTGWERIGITMAEKPPPAECESTTVLETPIHPPKSNATHLSI